jgi:hypothetical protein
MTFRSCRSQLSNVPESGSTTPVRVSEVDQRFVLFHNKRHPNELGAAEITASLTYLAVAERVSTSTQNQALALCCFCIERYCTETSARLTQCGPARTAACHPS